MTILGMTFDDVFASETITRQRFVAVLPTPAGRLLWSDNRRDLVRGLLNIE